MLARLELGAAALGVAGAAIFFPSLLIGRSVLFFPSASWFALFASAILALSAVWWLDTTRVRPRRHSWRRWQAAAWPRFVLLPAACAAGALYFDDLSHHVVGIQEPARQSLVAYVLVLYALAEAAFHVTTALASPAGQDRASVERWAAPALLGISVAAYVNFAVFTPWPPLQVDLKINLDGARELLGGGMPYRSDVEQWGDRVHLLPATLVLLFGPLTLVPEAVARVVFFAGNQLLWIAGLVLLARWLAPIGQRMIWLAGLLVLSALYWPWQEAVRFGQQDGLILVLYVISFAAAARGDDRLAGAALGLSLPIKPVSLWLPLVYVIHGRWRALVVAGAAALMVAIAALPWTGIDAWRVQLTEQLPDMLPGSVRSTNIPLAALHARFFVGREALGTGVSAPSYRIISALNAGATLAGLLLLARMWAGRRVRAAPKSSAAHRWLLDVSIGLLLTLLLAPYAWQHYASWLVIAFAALAAPSSWRPLAPPARLVLGILTGAAFFLLSLEDGKLLRMATPLVERWPGVMAFYPLGLLCLGTALALARFAPTKGDCQTADLAAGA